MGLPSAEISHLDIEMTCIYRRAEISHLDLEVARVEVLLVQLELT